MYSFRNFTVIFSGDLGFEEKIYHVKFFWPDIRPAGYPANETGYPAGYRISKKAGYPVQPYFKAVSVSDPSPDFDLKNHNSDPQYWY